MADEPSIEKNYPEAWPMFRRRLGWYWGTVIGLCVGEVLIAIPLAVWLPSDYPPLIFAVCIALLFAFNALKLSQLECPRCKNGFYASMGYGNPLTRSCVGCGLRVMDWVADEADH